MGHRRRLKRLEKNNRDAEYDRKRERERTIVGLIMVEYHRLPKPAHGEFGPWLKENFAGSDRTARAYMRFHAHREELQAKRQSSAVLSIDGALKALSVPKADAQGAVLSSYPGTAGRSPSSARRPTRCPEATRSPTSSRNGTGSTTPRSTAASARAGSGRRPYSSGHSRTPSKKRPRANTGCGNSTPWSAS